jgi:hypothetical protein
MLLGPRNGPCLEGRRKLAILNLLMLLATICY